MSIRNWINRVIIGKDKMS